MLPGGHLTPTPPPAKLRPRPAAPGCHAVLCLQVVAVDPSVQPPSYGIEIDGGYRETEAARLAPLPPQAEAEQEEQQEAVAVEGLGHRDAATEAQEAAARQLEE